MSSKSTAQASRSAPVNGSAGGRAQRAGFKAAAKSFTQKLGEKFSPRRSKDSEEVASRESTDPMKNPLQEAVFPMEAAPVKLQAPPKPKAAAASISNQDLLDALAGGSAPTGATTSSKDFKPLLVRVQDGVVHIVLQCGKTVHYIEAQAFELVGLAKVKVIGVANGAKDRYIDPAIQDIQFTLAPYLEKVGGAYSHARSKAFTTVQPIQVFMKDGVVYVRGAVDNTQIKLSAKVTAIKTQSHLAIQPVVDWSTAKATAARDGVVRVTEPALMRAKNGCLYVQTTIGDTVVRIKLGASEVSGKVSALVLKTYSSTKGAITGYTTPVIEKMVTLYNNIISRMTKLLGPHLQRLQGYATTFKVNFQDKVVAIKARAATARERTMNCASTCYMKVKGNAAYVYGVVGDRVIAIKVRITDLLAMLNDAIVKIGADYKAKIGVAKVAIQNKVSEASKMAQKTAADFSSTVKVAVTDRSNQVTTAGAVSGAATMGATGGATGLAFGAACGVPAAFFTFGLSIPVGALIGGATGAVAGGSAGFIGGGAAARSAHKHQHEIRDGMAAVSGKVSGYTSDMKEKAKEYKDAVAEKTGDIRPLSMMKKRLVGGTGGTV